VTTLRTITPTELKSILKKHAAWRLHLSKGERANLRYANLRYADLSGADLSDADLSYADLRYADLSGIAMWNTTGNRIHIKSLAISETYSIVYTNTHLQIGCENHPIIEWWKFNDERIERMDGDKAVTFWKDYKTFIKRAIKIAPAKPTGFVADESTTTKTNDEGEV